MCYIHADTSQKLCWRRLCIRVSKLSRSLWYTAHPASRNSADGNFGDIGNISLRRRQSNVGSVAGSILGSLTGNTGLVLKL